jgi:hypothetical protein
VTSEGVVRRKGLKVGTGAKIVVSKGTVTEESLLFLEGGGSFWKRIQRIL